MLTTAIAVTALAAGYALGRASHRARWRTYRKRPRLRYEVRFDYAPHLRRTTPTTEEPTP